MHAGPLEAALQPLREQQWRMANSFRLALGQPPLPPPWETGEERAHRGHVAALKEALADPAIAQALQAALPAPTTAQDGRTQGGRPEASKLVEDRILSDLLEWKRDEYLQGGKGDADAYLGATVRSRRGPELAALAKQMPKHARRLSKGDKIPTTFHSHDPKRSRGSILFSGWKPERDARTDKPSRGSNGGGKAGKQKDLTPTAQLPAPPHDFGSVDDRLDADHDNAAARAAIAKLPSSSDQELATAVCIDGLTAKQIATNTRTSVEAVEERIDRIIPLISKIMTSDPESR